jgi:hypothetical protein
MISSFRIYFGHRTRAFLAPLLYVVVSIAICGCTFDSGSTKGYNHLSNPTGEDELESWTSSGEVSIAEDEDTVSFRTADRLDERAYLYQDVSIANAGSENYLCLISTVYGEPDSAAITELPYVYGYLLDRDENIVTYLQQDTCIHDGSADDWIIVYGIFEVPESARSARVVLKQAYQDGTPPAGEYARFRDADIRVFGSQEEAERHLDVYLLNHFDTGVSEPVNNAEI